MNPVPADPSVLHPIPGQPRVVLLKPLVTLPLIEVGEYSYYDDPDELDAFESRNVLYHYGPEKLIIGKFCALGTGVRFIMNGANHRLDGPSTFPFPILGGSWAEHFDLITGLPGRGLQGDQRADADPEHLVRAGPGHDGPQVLDLGAHAVAGAVRAGQAAATPVGQVDGERVGQREGELGVAAGRLVAAVQQHHGRALPEPQLADPGPVGGGNRACGHLGDRGLGGLAGVHLVLLLGGPRCMTHIGLLAFRRTGWARWSCTASRRGLSALPRAAPRLCAGSL